MISPQGYNIPEPSNTSPFWGEGEDQDVNRIYATATVDDSVGTPSVQTTKSVDGHDITFGFNFRNLKGRDGTNGTDGSDGVSPTITVADITGGHRVSITDASGTHAFNVMNGTDGQDGRDGTNGTDGRDGTDGVSPSVSVSDITGGHRITVTDATGSETFDVMNGTDGQNGQNGQDGVSPTVSVTSITGGHQVSITDAQGTDTFNVMDGTDGQNGQNGQDGVTPDITMTATADATSSANPAVTVTKGGTTANPTFALAFSGLKGEQGTAGANGQGVPTGGTAGQVLAKIDGTDYNTEWITPSGGGGGYTPKRYNFNGTPTISVVKAAKQNDAANAAMARVQVGPINFNGEFVNASDSSDKLSMYDIESLIIQGKGYLMVYGRSYNSRPYSDLRYYLPASLLDASTNYYVTAVGWDFLYDTEFSLYFVRTAQ